MLQEARNTPFCPSQDKFLTFVLRGVRNISGAPYNPSMKLLLPIYIWPIDRLLRRADPRGVGVSVREVVTRLGRGSCHGCVARQSVGE